MMTDLETLDKLHAKKVVEAEVVQNDLEESGEEESLVTNDLCNGVQLIRKCFVLLDYMSDKDLCKTLSQRERDAMIRLSDRLHEYNDEVTAEYEDLQ